MSWRRRLTEAVAAATLLALLALALLQLRHPASDSSTLATDDPAGGGSAAPSPSASVSPAPSTSGTFAGSPSGTPSGSLSAPPSATAPTPSRTAPRPRTPVIGDPLSSALAGQVAPTTASPTPTRAPTRTPSSAPSRTLALDFTLATFNVLGASHTTSGGEKAARPSGQVRAGRAAELIRRHQADVVGFQELQGSQLAVLQRATDLEFYPGFSLRRPDTENSIGWRRDLWTAVQKRTVRIPYFNGGQRAMPVVLLRSRQTGLQAWFANFHNPAETARFHRQQRFRTRATSIEAQLANRLMATRVPVFITGDMNERASYFCRLTSRSPMVAARGGTHAGGRCQAGRPRAVDWIFGSPGVTFSGYTEDRSHLVDITTDHPVVSTRVRIVGTAATP